MFMVNQLVGFGAEPAAPVLTYLQATNDDSNLTTYSWASQNFGTASPNRYLIAAFACAAAANVTGSSCTIGGISATKAVEVTANVTVGGLSMWIAPVPTGTSGTVAITWSGAAVRAAVALYAVTGLQSATPTATSTHNAAVSGVTSGTITIQAQGVAVGASISVDAVTGFTWAGLTESGSEVNLEAGAAEFSSASLTPSTTQTSLAWSATDGAVATRSPIGIVAAFR